MDNQYTARLADYAATLRYEDLPKAVVEQAKLMILDGIGCGLFGTTLPWYRITASLLGKLESGGKATVFGTKLRVSAPHAALANGTAIQGFELDDLHVVGLLHTASVTLPPALGVAEQIGGIDGRTIITAIVAGCEVGTRVGMCMGLEAQRRGFHHPSIYGTFASVVAAGRVAGLTGKEMVHAFGHAGTLASGLMAVQYGGMMKRMLAGRTCQTGVYAALLAQEGFTGVTNIFEADYGGFCTAFATSKDAVDRSLLVEGLGQQYNTLGLEFKMYACRGPIHSPLDAIRMLRQRHPLPPEAIEKVTVRVGRMASEVVGWKYIPRDVTSAQLNLAYGVAVMLLEGDAFIDQYTEEKIAAPEVLAMIDRIEVVYDPSLDSRDLARRNACAVEVQLKDGQRLEIQLDRRKGSEEPFSREEIVDKFYKLAAKVTDRQRADRIIEKVGSLERLNDIASLTQELSL